MIRRKVDIKPVKLINARSVTVDSQRGTSRNANPKDVLRRTSNTSLLGGLERSLRDVWLVYVVTRWRVML